MDEETAGGTLVCPSCGRANARGSSFCANPDCRAYLEWDATQTIPRSSGSAPRSGAAGQAPSRTPAAARGAASPAPPEEARGRQPAEPVNRGVAEERVGLTATLQPTLILVEPGGRSEATVRITNTGTRIEEVKLWLFGPATAVTSLTDETVRIYPGAESRTTLVVDVPRGPSPTAGEHELLMVAASTLTGARRDVPATVLVGTCHELTASLEPSRSRGRRRGFAHRLEVHNGGNHPVTVDVGLDNEPDRLTWSAPPDHLEADPGASVVVPLEGEARRRWFGQPETIPFSVDLRERDHRPGAFQQVLPGTRVQVPLLPRWLLTLLVLLLALLVFLVAFLTGRKTEVPAVAGETSTQAIGALSEAGFVVSVHRKADDEVRAGDAIATDPPAGTPLADGSRVALLVSSGPHGNAPQVPSLLGLRQGEAIRRLAAVGLVGVRAGTETTTDVQPGRVVRSDPTTGITLPKGSRVGLIVATTPSSPTAAASSSDTALSMPPLAGTAVADALQTLHDLGLTDVTQEKQPSTEVPRGRIISSDPSAGSPLTVGDPVTLRVSSGPPVTDLTEIAPEARWESSVGPLEYDAADTGAGTAQPMTGTLEDGSTSDKAIVLTPPEGAGSFLRGQYLLSRPMRAGDRLTARIGYPQGQTDRMAFYVTAIMPDKSVLELDRVIADPTDGELRDLDVDLSPAAGTNALRIKVEAVDGGAGDAGVWVDPTFVPGGP